MSSNESGLAVEPDAFATSLKEGMDHSAMFGCDVAITLNWMKREVGWYCNEAPQCNDPHWRDKL